jgi:hypothetical protein
MLNHTLKELPAHSPILLDNMTCPYCGILLDAEDVTKEHVVGRRFVSKGTLDQRWNLILKACRPCDTRKSDLENDISAVSMQPTAAGQLVRSDQAFVAEGRRKAARTMLLVGEGVFGL